MYISNKFVISLGSNCHLGIQSSLKLFFFFPVYIMLAFTWVWQPHYFGKSLEKAVHFNIHTSWKPDYSWHITLMDVYLFNPSSNLRTKSISPHFIKSLKNVTNKLEVHSKYIGCKFLYSRPAGMSQSNPWYSDVQTHMKPSPADSINSHVAPFWHGWDEQ